MTPQHVVLLGASWAARSGSLAAALATALGATVTPMGHSGASLGAWSTEPDAVLPPGGYALVLEMGGNTALMHAADVLEAHRRITSRGGRAVWVWPPSWPRDTPSRDRVADGRDRARAAIEAAGVPQVRVRWTAEAHHLHDYAHLSPDGARAFADAIVGAMRRRALREVGEGLLVVGALVAAFVRAVRA